MAIKAKIDHYRSQKPEVLHSSSLATFFLCKVLVQLPKQVAVGLQPLELEGPKGKVGQKRGVVCRPSYLSYRDQKNSEDSPKETTSGRGVADK